VFIPDATILGIEPISADFSFQGYQAEIPTQLSFDGSLSISKEGRFNYEAGGEIQALKSAILVTKS